MKYLKLTFVLTTLLLFFTIISFYNEDQLSVDIVDRDQLLANISKILTKPKTTESLLVNYPFSLLSPEVTIAEGFEA